MKVCPVTVRHGLHTELHTRSGLSVVIGMTWRAWAFWRAAPTDSPNLVWSEYRLERLRTNMTLSVPLVLNFEHKKLVLFCTFRFPNITCPRRTLGRCNATWHNLTIQALVGSLSYTPKLVLAGSFSYTSRVSFSEESILHSPCCFQWAVLGTLLFNHACMPDVSFSETHQTTDVVEFHVGRQKSYSTLI